MPHYKPYTCLGLCLQVGIELGLHFWTGMFQDQQNMYHHLFEHINCVKPVKEFTEEVSTFLFIGRSSIVGKILREICASLFLM